MSRSCDILPLLWRLAMPVTIEFDSQSLRDACTLPRTGNPLWERLWSSLIAGLCPGAGFRSVPRGSMTIRHRCRRRAAAPTRKPRSGAIRCERRAEGRGSTSALCSPRRGAARLRSGYGAGLRADSFLFHERRRGCAIKRRAVCFPAKAPATIPGFAGPQAAWIPA
jgi:hypothetical protein